MKKCVKKIPKYDGGTPAVTPSPTFYQDPNFYSQFGNFLGQQIDNVQQSKQGVTAGGVAKGALTGAATGAAIGSVVPGIGTAIGAGAGALIGGITSSIGHGGRVNQLTGDSELADGMVRRLGLGRDDRAVMKESNRIKSANISKTNTQHLLTNYYNNTPGAGSINVLAAEGGIMRQPVDALVSKGELIYNPVTKKLSQVPGSKGKPNKADDVYAKLYEGDVVISNSPTMLMANGKTPAQNLMGMVDKYATGDTVKAREAIIKKVVNWQEANKTKPQEYAMYDEGTGKGGVQSTETKKVKVRKKEKVKYVVWNDKFGYFDAEGGFHDMSDVSNANLPDSNYLGRYEWVDVPVEKVKSNNTSKNQETNKEVKKPSIPAEVVEEPTTTSNIGKHTSDVLNFNTDRHTRDGVKDKEVKKSNNWRRTPTQEEIDAFFGHDHEKVSATVAKDRTERINNKNRKYLVEDENEMIGSIPEVVITGRRPNKTTSVTSNKNTKDGSAASTPISVTGTIENPILPEYDRLSFAEPFQFNNQHLRYAPGNYVPIKPLDIEVEDEIVDEVGLPTGNSKLNINWGDLAYKAASILTPLFDKEKPESVQYQVPVAKYRPTYVDVDPQRRAIDESYAMTRYNQFRINPNTGAGMAYGLQAASNRAKQLADVYSWQTNTQNNLIGQNVDTYNKWSADYANIMNNVYDKNAANRATARNINRQNAATALKNWGQIRRDDKAYEMDKMKLQMLDPMLQYGYENYDNYLKWKKENGYG